MKKSEQMAINAHVQIAEKSALNIWNTNNHGAGENLNHMSAKIFSIADYKFLVSYDTLVAFCVDGIGFDIMRERYFYKKPSGYFEGYWTNYSNATAKQISKFFKLCNVKQVFTYRDI